MLILRTQGDPEIKELGLRVGLKDSLERSKRVTNL